jgi:RNA polymerase sigma-70 factor (ECF subfamily)
VHELTRRAAVREVQPKADGQAAAVLEREETHKAQAGLESLEEVQKLLKKLPARERQVVRLCYLEGRSYEEISTELHIPVNSIGAILSRAKRRLRKDVKKAPPVKSEPPKAPVSKTTTTPNP